MSAADVCRQMVEALNARDWRALAASLDERTEVTDHRERPFEGTGARMLGVWRSVFDTTPSARADLEVLDRADDAALVRLGIGDDEGRLVVHAVVEVQGAHVARFEAFPPGGDGERAARARFAH